MPKLTTNQARNGGHLQEIIKKPTTISTGGMLVNPRTQPDKYQVALTLKKSQTSTNSTISLNESAKMLLKDFGYSHSSESTDYSLITTCGDTETIDNENIVDLNAFKNTKAAPTSADDKFSVDDPFFNLDDDIPTAYSERNKILTQEKEPDFIAFLARLSTSEKETTTTTTTAVTTDTTAATTTTTTTTY